MSFNGYAVVLNKSLVNYMGLNILRFITLHLIMMAGGHGFAPIVMSQVFIFQDNGQGAIEWLLLAISLFVIQIVILVALFVSQRSSLKGLQLIEWVGVFGVAAFIVHLALMQALLAVVPLLTALPYLFFSLQYFRRL